jgi:lactobin A/cerein 7B family class IIb bacteriocin
MDLVVNRKVAWKDIDWITKGMLIEPELLQNLSADDLKEVELVNGGIIPVDIAVVVGIALVASAAIATFFHLGYDDCTTATKGNRTTSTTICN